jgi:hypothetical protein
MNEKMVNRLVFLIYGSVFFCLALSFFCFTVFKFFSKNIFLIATDLFSFNQKDRSGFPSFAKSGRFPTVFKSCLRRRTGRCWRALSPTGLLGYTLDRMHTSCRGLRSSSPPSCQSARPTTQHCLAKIS